MNGIVGFLGIKDITGIILQNTIKQRPGNNIVSNIKPKCVQPTEKLSVHRR